MELQLQNLLEKAAMTAKEKGQLFFDDFPSVPLEAPKEKGHGDYSSTIAMALAGQSKMPPKLVAETIVQNLPPGPPVFEKVEVAGPGFINFFLADGFFQENLRSLSAEIQRSAGDSLKETPGTVPGKVKKKILIEFVSANPTGPLNIVNARAAAVGDALAKLLEACGDSVDREFYVNNEGSQLENLARSVETRYLELLGNPPREFPADWYAGEYVKDLAKNIRDGFRDAAVFDAEGKRIYGEKIFSKQRLEQLQSGFQDRLQKNIPGERDRLEFLGAAVVIFMVHQQKNALERFRLTFQSWYYQSQLKDQIKDGIELLKKKGHVYEKDGALWLRTTTFRDDKDRVLVRQDGEPTYFAADIAYHIGKKKRGYDRLIDLMGPDHHGYLARAKASLQALEYPAGTLEIYIIQLVTLVSGGKTLRMSKRAGEFITMEGLLDEVGVDAARWYFLHRHRDSHLEFDLDLAKLQSDENPLYYVQYAHARICSIMQMAEKEGLAAPPSASLDLSVLTHPMEKELMKKIGQWKTVIKMSAEIREPHHLTRYAVEVARAFHAFYAACRVLGADTEKKLSEARLFLIAACREVIVKILDLMGISAPSKM